MDCRLLALDVDGTLLDPTGTLRPVVRNAVTAARDAGIEVVLCTGRRFRTARPLLDALGLSGAVVVQNGVLVKDGASARTLQHRYLPRDVYREALAILRGRLSPLLYVDHYEDELDILYERAGRPHPYQAQYMADHGEAARGVERLDDPPSEAISVLSCMADETSLAELRRDVTAALGPQVRTNLLMNKNYRGHILEVVSADSGKWPALAGLARMRGVPNAAVAAIGDDTNDAEMIREAGLGIAMGNAPASVRAGADRVAPDNAEDGAALAIERFVLGRG